MWKLYNGAKLGAALILSAVSLCAAAQSYPTRPVKVVIPYSAGTGIDIIARMVAQALASSLNQPFVVENRTGASGTIAAAYVASSPADGYTILIDASAHTSVPALMPSLPFDTARDFAGVTTIVENPLVMVAAKSKGFQSVADVIAAAKAKPGGLTYASAGYGTGTSMSAEKFRVGAKLDVLHVPYKSTTDAFADVLAARIDYTYTGLASALPSIRDGRLVALAMSSKRSPLLPEVPTIEEAGVPGAAYSQWVGVIVAAKTPPEIVDTLYRETAKVLATPEMKERLAKIGAQPQVMTPAEFDAVRRQELDENARLIKSMGIKTQ